MGYKRIVHTRLWQDADVMDRYTPEDKYFLLYLLTNPHTKLCGIYLLPRRYIAFEMGYSPEAVTGLIDRFQRTHKNIIYNADTQEVAVLNSLKYGIVSGGQVVENLIRHELKGVEDGRLVSAVFDNMDDFWESTQAREIDRKIKTIFEAEIESRLNTQTKSKLSTGYGYGYGYGYGESGADSAPESISESTVESVPESKETKKDLQRERFDEFWSLYPRKVGKQAALKAWRKIRPDADLHAKIVAAVNSQKTTEQWTIENGRFVPNPTTWLNQGRWDDELPKGNGQSGGRQGPYVSERDRIKEAHEYDHPTDIKYSPVFQAFYEKELAKKAQEEQNHD